MFCAQTRKTLAAFAVVAGLAAAGLAEDLYVAGDSGQIWHLDTDTGTLANPVSFGGGTVEGLVLQGRDVLAASSDGNVYRVNLDTGITESSFGAWGNPLSMTRWGNTLYLTTDGGEVQWLDAEDGTLIDTYYVHDVQQASVLFGGTIYTGSWSTFVYKSPIDGMNFEFFTVCGGSVNSMATDGVDLLIGSREGTIYVFDATLGTYKVTYPVASDCVGLEYADGSLFIAGSDGLIHRMNLSTGEIERVYDTGLTITAMAGPDACAADFNGDGEISTLDFLAFLNAWAAMESSADMDGNGTVNTQDVLVFLNAFTAGCE